MDLVARSRRVIRSRVKAQSLFEGRRERNRTLRSLRLSRSVRRDRVSRSRPGLGHVVDFDERDARRVPFAAHDRSVIAGSDVQKLHLDHRIRSGTSNPGK